ncbi:hypothetical protein [Variovorax paradoxus]|uniref:hypothetical protein n=1 Tax=Variovorax paradoxus TaxID=34073 RepID=UPI0019320BF4|nr:hypothetical protein INQ48_43520 [Variovorax paradoxus]
MSSDIGELLVRMTVLLGQLQQTLNDIAVCNESIKDCRRQHAGEPPSSEVDGATHAQYVALEEAIRQQTEQAARARQSACAQVTPPPSSGEIFLGSSSWRLSMNGWRLAKEEGVEVRLRPQERSLLLRVARAPSQFLAPHEVKELNRSLVDSADNVAKIDAAEEDIGSQAGEETLDLLHTKVIGRLRRRMRMNGHLLPLRMSAAGSVYVDEAGDLPRATRRRPGAPNPLHPQRMDKAKSAPRPDIRIATGLTVGGRK